MGQKGISTLGIPVLFICLLLSADLLAQARYQVVATRGTSGLIFTPGDRQLRVGDTFIARRVVNGTEIDVARVVVALVDRKYCGLKIDEPMAGSALAKGDYIVDESFSFDNRISFLDDILASNENPAAENPAPAEGTPITSLPEDGVLEGNGSSRPILLNNPLRARGREIRSFIGPSIAGIAAVAGTADQYSGGPQIGMQLLTPMSSTTNIRLNLQHAFLQSNVDVRNALTAVGANRTSSLTMLTGSVQPRLINNMILDLGVGVYRQYDEVNAPTRRSTAIRNAVGTIAGIGYHTKAGATSTIMILATANFYFLSNNSETFAALTASWMLGL